MVLPSMLKNIIHKLQNITSCNKRLRWIFVFILLLLLPVEFFIFSILKKKGVPDDFKYIALIESNLTNSVSPKRATGFWQFVESAAKQYGLEVNDEVDERYHLEKSTEAA